MPQIFLSFVLLNHDAKLRIFSDISKFFSHFFSVENKDFFRPTFSVRSQPFQEKRQLNPYKQSTFPYAKSTESVRKIGTYKSYNS